ncbi:MAG: aldo/keto reductase [Paracoccaceae bacterium]|nr:MAG: aldo/keto reductase [Paracoccaceae bacterium]
MSPTLRLLDGHAIPQLGFGLWQVADAARITETALSQGYRLVDGAAIYGNEVGMGQGIAASGLPRDQVFVTTKVWNDRQGRDSTRAAVGESLDRLRLDRLDLVLIHWPCPGQDRYVETWRALIDLRSEGAVTSIGVSNFDAVQIDRLMAETGVMPVLNQIELHPRLQQAALRAAHAERGVITQSWTPLGRGGAFEAAPVRAIAERRGISPAQAILRWHLDLGVSVIPRSTRAEGLAQNLAVLGADPLDPDEMAAMAGLDAGERTGPDPAVFG